MTRYADDSKEKVRDAVDMLALVGSRTQLTRKGHDSYFGVCPFHDERTPSFHVRPDEKHYHCFGCGVSGDPFDFVMETEGVGFKEALEILAERFSVQLEAVDEDPRAAERRAEEQRLLSLLDRAAAFYARYLWDSGEAAGARSYLLGRGLTEETLRAFRVGYAPSAWDRLLLNARRAGFSDNDLVATGLALRSRSRPGSIYDRFRERITFPLADERGRVRGFGARAMRSNQEPKYVNTNENAVFSKRHQLFAVDVARRPASREGRIVLAEGYTDVLAFNQAGVPWTVGIMGTSLTEEQVAALKRIASTLLLALDADSAGQEAMLRAAERAGAQGLELRVVPLPPGADPADLLLSEGVDALRARVEQSRPFVEFHVDHLLATIDTSTAEGRDRALLLVRPIITGLPASVLRDELVRTVAGRLELSEALAATLISGDMPIRPAAGAASREVVVAPSSVGRDTEEGFLLACLAKPADGRAALASLKPDVHFTGEMTRRAARYLADHLADGMSAPPDDPELAAYLDQLRRRLAREPVTPIPVARTGLELNRLQRAIDAAAQQQPERVADLAAERENVRRELQELLAEAAGAG